ncbi:MAG TPA: hypothetical protein VMB18_00665 [Terriglobales bacterium]|nr:hypothetical protein [Terriglobales bacterium]
MKHNFFAFCLILALALSALAQDSAPASQAPATSPDRTQTADNAGVNALLKSYVNAYTNRSIDDLVAVWPDLQNQKKEYRKISEHFKDSKISKEKLSLDQCETQAVKDQAMATCQQTEEYVKTETQTSYGGDAMMASPAQRPPPTQQDLKHNVKKTQTVWVKMQKQGDTWKIVSVSDKKQTL